jgi:anti-sigma-K factor RskA
MTCEDFVEQSAAYVLGILDPAERAACLQHLEGAGPHRGCTAAVAEAQAVAASLAQALPHHRPSRQVWRAIEARLGELPREPRARRRLWRELAGWFVAAAVIGVYLYSVPLDTRRRAVAVEAAPSMVRESMTLMTAPGTRVLVFRARRADAGRASLIMSASEGRAVVLCDHVPPESARRLRLWAIRGDAAPMALGPLALSEEGVAWAQLGPAFFGPSAPDRLLISADDPSALIPTEVLLSAELR